MGPELTDTASHNDKRAAGTERTFDPWVTLTVCLTVGFLLVAWRAAATADSARPWPSSLESVDPNQAPWEELTVLPGVGETRARAIVGFRESSAPSQDDRSGKPVFRRAADLAQVRGIGPKTVARLAPYLRFDDF